MLSPSDVTLGRQLIAATARVYGIAPALVASSNREPDPVDARTVVAVFLRERGWSQLMIGSLWGSPRWKPRRGRDVLSDDVMRAAYAACGDALAFQVNRTPTIEELQHEIEEVRERLDRLEHAMDMVNLARAS